MSNIGSHTEDTGNFLVDALEGSHTTNSISVLVIPTEQVFVAFYCFELYLDLTVVLSNGENSFVSLLDTNRTDDELNVVYLLIKLVMTILYNNRGKF